MYLKEGWISPLDMSRAAGYNVERQEDRTERIRIAITISSFHFPIEYGASGRCGERAFSRRMCRMTGHVPLRCACE